MRMQVEQAARVLPAAARVLAAALRRPTHRDGARRLRGGDPGTAAALERFARSSGRLTDADAEALVDAVKESSDAS